MSARFFTRRWRKKKQLGEESKDPLVQIESSRAKSLLRRGRFEVFFATFEQGTEGALQASGGLLSELPPQVLHRIRSWGPNWKQVGLNSARFFEPVVFEPVVFEPVGNLTRGVPRGLVADQNHLAFDLRVDFRWAALSFLDEANIESHFGRRVERGHCPRGAVGRRGAACPRDEPIRRDGGLRPGGR